MQMTGSLHQSAFFPLHHTDLFERTNLKFNGCCLVVFKVPQSTVFWACSEHNKMLSNAEKYSVAIEDLQSEVCAL